MIKHTSNIRVRYADTDQMRSVYYGKYFEYFEQSRSDLLRSLGLPYSEIESHGTFLPVIEAYAKYRKSARYDDLLIVEAVVTELPVARVRIHYRVLVEGETEPIVEGYTVHGFVNVSTGKPTRAPAMFLQTLEEAMKKPGDPHAKA
jgi:acyl-CoA thioester hydrolase